MPQGNCQKHIILSINEDGSANKDSIPLKKKHQVCPHNHCFEQILKKNMKRHIQSHKDCNESCPCFNLNNNEEEANNSQNFDEDIRMEIEKPPSIINRVTRLFRSKIINKIMNPTVNGKMDESSLDSVMDDDDDDDEEQEEEDPIEREYINGVMEKFKGLYESFKHAKQQEEEMDRSLMSQLFWLREIIINHPILSSEDLESQYGELKSVGTKQIKELIQQCKKSKEQKEFRNTFPLIEFQIRGVESDRSSFGGGNGDGNGDCNSSGENQYFSLDELCNYTDNLKQYINLCMHHREKYLKHQRFYDEGFLKCDLKLDFFKVKDMKISLSTAKVAALKTEMGLSAQQIQNILRIFTFEKRDLNLYQIESFIQYKRKRMEEIFRCAPIDKGFIFHPADIIAYEIARQNTVITKPVTIKPSLDSAQETSTRKHSMLSGTIEILDSTISHSKSVLEIKSFSNCKQFMVKHGGEEYEHMRDHLSLVWKALNSLKKESKLKLGTLVINLDLHMGGDMKICYHYWKQSSLFSNVIL
ncbi:hypothetical protein DLAC_02968 [Tieghemostelium lacteum]|uniref:Uncharacterized protein n=1 Tax=Tieghemostelium lacteum TaxID=361077 RepID=A0A152A3V0_TIELA|nr:hypothetical protein DLAC_02968 [Tieghemostelium lacteum]|eukprot:KYR00906.1 hypothetical protein DLAC_02968 [Tieghemostelium lacteum]